MDLFPFAAAAAAAAAAVDAAVAASAVAVLGRDVSPVVLGAPGC